MQRPALNGKRRALLSLALAAAIGLGTMAPWVARADDVQNEIAAGSSDSFIIGGSTTVNYYIQALGGADPQRGCNASDGTAATVTINTPSGLTATPSSLTFTKCAGHNTNAQSVVFTASAAGDYEATVSVSDSGTGTYNLNPGKITLHVSAPAGPHTTSTAVACSPDTILLNGTTTCTATVTDTAASGQTTPVGTVDFGSSKSGSFTGDPCTLSGSGSSASCSVTFNATQVGLHTVSGAYSPTSNHAASTGSNAASPLWVKYDWTGFSQPVDNSPVLNSVKAGSAVPVKFNLGGNQGTGIFLDGYPKPGTISCSTSSVDVIEETSTAGNSSLTYDTVAQQYIYVWKTNKADAGKCLQLVLRLVDGTDQIAKFSLTK